MGTKPSELFLAAAELDSQEHNKTHAQFSKLSTSLRAWAQAHMGTRFLLRHCRDN